MGPGAVLVGYRYSTPPDPPGPHHPGYTPRCRESTGTLPHGHAGQRNSGVGLKSVAQLSLYALISGFLGITEVYNLLRIGRIINHLVIPGNK